MRGLAEIIAPGMLAGIQDIGRRGFRRLGVPWSGALDPQAMRIANALAGNHGDSPVIEFFGGGFALKALEGPIRLGLAGNFPDSWRSLHLAPGEVFKAGMISGGRVGYVAISGLEADEWLKSASVYVRAGMGSMLAPGARLACLEAFGDAGLVLPVPPPVRTEGPVRVVLGPQDDFFAPESIAAFLSAEFEVTAESDRMGMRLAGPPLTHRPEKGAEIVSDATFPGSIQVPGNGRPIVLLADGQTAGGYPKIATVVSSDLPRLASALPGSRFTFSCVSAGEGVRLARRREAETLALLASIRPAPPPGGIDLGALYAANLVDGVFGGD